MSAVFHSWTPSRRQEFLDFCSGNRGIRILYDSYFKYVFNPDTHAAELSRMISALIGQDVKIVQILPNESHLGADYTLVIMDIIVETADESVVNVEVQKIGYNFPGERAACYNADLLLRQYQRIRKEYSAVCTPAFLHRRVLTDAELIVISPDEGALDRTRPYRCRTYPHMEI